jgi:hypothetical protein
MSKEQSKRIRTAIIGWVLLTAVFATMQTVASHDNHFKVIHHTAVSTEVGPDGRAAVGSPEVVQVQISPALAWQLTDYAKIYVILGWVMVALIAGFIGLVTLDIIPVDKAAFNIFWVGMSIVAAGLIFGAYSSAYAANYKEVYLNIYLQYKDHLQDLFTTPIIR